MKKTRQSESEPNYDILSIPIGHRAINDRQSAKVIEADNSATAVRLEREWLEVNFPGFEKLGQELYQKDQGKTFELIYIVSSEGEKLSVWFDITGAFEASCGEDE